MRGATPNPDPQGKPLEITLKARAWDWGDTTPSFVLRPRKTYNGRPANEWDAHLPTGEFIGIVGRYQGSIDTKVGRLRREGVRRTLWHYQNPSMDRPTSREVSRADCLRTLLDDHKRAARKGKA